MLLFASGCQKQDVRDDLKSIKTLLDEWVRLYNAGEYEALVSAFYTDHAVLISPYGPPHEGRASILNSYLADAGMYEEHCDSSEARDIRISANLAVAWGTDAGTETLKGGGTSERYAIRWVMAFERQTRGSWKCVYEIWNENNALTKKAADLDITTE